MNLNPKIHPSAFQSSSNTSDTPKFLQYAFAIFVFVVPFETIQTPFTSDEFSLAKYFGLLFFLVALHRRKYAFQRVNLAVAMFLVYVIVHFVSGIFQDEALRENAIRRSSTMLQMVTFMWISMNMLVDRQTRRMVLLSVGYSCLLLGILQLMAISSVSYSSAENRISAFGEDPNSLSAVLVLGFLSLVFEIYATTRSSRASKLIFIPGMVIILSAIIATGSRGGMIALFVGIILVFTASRSHSHRSYRTIIVIVGLVTVYYFNTESNTMASRLERSWRSGSLSSREAIYPAAWEMFVERPLIGWGPMENYRELGRRTNSPTRDTHNLVLLVLTEVGFIGGLPYLVGVFLCALASWKAKRWFREESSVVFLTVLLLINMSVTWHTRKYHWLFLGYALATAIVPGNVSGSPKPGLFHRSSVLRS